MQVKLVVALFVSGALSWFAASGAFAARTPEPNAYQSAQIVGAQAQSSDGALNKGALFTSTITATVTPTSTLSAGNDKIAKAIADRFGVDVKEVLSIHDQIHGWGEVFLVFLLADKSGKSPEEILAMRESGGGWGRIFMELGLHPGLKKDNLGGAITGRPTPTPMPTASTFVNQHKPGDDDSQESNDDDNNCIDHANNKGGGHLCSNQFPSGNGHPNHRPNGGKGH